MGIKGLTSYVQMRSKHYLVDYKLSQSTVVIDGMYSRASYSLLDLNCFFFFIQTGNNFMCVTYQNCSGQNPCYGGDYNLFYRHFKELFLNLKKCEITPVVLLDGTLDPSNKKRYTRLLRAKQKLYAAVSCNPSNQHK